MLIFLPPCLFIRFIVTILVPFKVYVFFYSSSFPFSVRQVQKEKKDELGPHDWRSTYHVFVGTKDYWTFGNQEGNVTFLPLFPPLSFSFFTP